jgi:hypothetical protein
MSRAHRANRMMNLHVALMTRALLTLAQAGALLACFGTWAVFLGLFT